MIEVKADIWKYPCHWICITTNEVFRLQDGNLPVAVMGAGIARQAAIKFEDLPYLLGERLQKWGSKVCILRTFTRDTYVPTAPQGCYQLDQVVVSLLSFPTKHDYKKNSDLKLIEKSCAELKKLYDIEVFRNKNYFDRPPYIPKIVLPRPGCGCGGLNWEKEVKPICEKYFINDDFIICNKD